MSQLSQLSGLRQVIVALLLGCASSRPAVVDASVVFAPRMAGDPVDGHVRCSMARAGEMSCSISHEGTTALQVCFHADVKCANGTLASAEACRQTPPGAEVVTFHQADGCDAIGEGRITNAWIIGR